MTTPSAQKIMGMNKHFTLTSRKGIFSAGTDRVTTIGQLDGCDVKINNPTQYADEVFAKIFPNREGDGWHLVKTTKYWPITVNGVEMNRVHYLIDGDVIGFPNYNCRFNIRDGKEEKPSVIYVHKYDKLLWSIIVALAVVLAIVGYRIYDTSRENISLTMQKEIEASLFTTRVDSLQLLYNDSLVSSYAYASSPIGTAFLTTDSMLITARHCIQPWLNYVKPYEYRILPTISEWPIEKALLAETENQFSGFEEYRIISFLTITDENGNNFHITSDQFSVNRNFDEIIELGDYDTTFYWRSISHRYHNQEMMLGDIAVAKYNRSGKIPIANASDIKRLLNQKGVKLVFFGHPESGVNGNQLDRISDELRLPIKQLECDSSHISMLAHGGFLSPGFSGGPVIVRNGLGYAAVGIISVIDEKNGQRSYSVPTTEVKFLLP